MSLQKRQFGLFSRSVAICIIISMIMNLVILPPQANAQSLPLPTTFAPQPTGAFSPMIVKGINIDPVNPFKFDFIIEKGKTDFSENEFRQESTKLIKYFLSSLTVPEKEMWVNLSPYEKDRVIPDIFGTTEMGRDLLAQDYLLKQLTASLLAPESKTGEAFWRQIEQKTKDLNLPDVLGKIWITPDQATIYEHAKGAFVVESRLKVKLSHPSSDIRHQSKSLKTDDRRLTTILQQTILPTIEREVNVGPTFAKLRQIYNSMLLATWFKNKLKTSVGARPQEEEWHRGHPLRNFYIDQQKTKGLEIEDREANQKIYNQYVEAFKQGVYDFIKEDYDPAAQQTIPKKYFTGGVELFDAAMVTRNLSSPIDIDNGVIVSMELEAKLANNQQRKLTHSDLAMTDTNVSEPLVLASGIVIEEPDELSEISTAPLSGPVKRKWHGLVRRYRTLKKALNENNEAKAKRAMRDLNRAILEQFDEREAREVKNHIRLLLNALDENVIPQLKEAEDEDYRWLAKTIDTAEDWLGYSAAGVVDHVEGLHRKATNLVIFTPRGAATFLGLIGYHTRNDDPNPDPLDLDVSMKILPPLLEHFRSLLQDPTKRQEAHEMAGALLNGILSFAETPYGILRHRFIVSLHLAVLDKEIAIPDENEREHYVYNLLREAFRLQTYFHAESREQSYLSVRTTQFGQGDVARIAAYNRENPSEKPLTLWEFAHVSPRMKLKLRAIFTKEQRDVFIDHEHDKREQIIANLKKRVKFDPQADSAMIPPQGLVQVPLELASGLKIPGAVGAIYAEQYNTGRAALDTDPIMHIPDQTPIVKHLVQSYWEFFLFYAKVDEELQIQLKKNFAASMRPFMGAQDDPEGVVDLDNLTRDIVNRLANYVVHFHSNPKEKYIKISDLPKVTEGFDLYVGQVMLGILRLAFPNGYYFYPWGYHLNDEGEWFIIFNNQAGPITDVHAIDTMGSKKYRPSNLFILETTIAPFNVNSADFLGINALLPETEPRILLGFNKGHLTKWSPGNAIPNFQSFTKHDWPKLNALQLAYHELGHMLDDLYGRDIAKSYSDEDKTHQASPLIGQRIGKTNQTANEHLRAFIQQLQLNPSFADLEIDQLELTDENLELIHWEARAITFSMQVLTYIPNIELEIFRDVFYSLFIAEPRTFLARLYWAYGVLENILDQQGGSLDKPEGEYSELEQIIHRFRKGSMEKDDLIPDMNLLTRLIPSSMIGAANQNSFENIYNEPIIDDINVIKSRRERLAKFRSFYSQTELGQNTIFPELETAGADSAMTNLETTLDQADVEFNTDYFTQWLEKDESLLDTRFSVQRDDKEKMTGRFGEAHKAGSILHFDLISIHYLNGRFVARNLNDSVPPEVTRALEIVSQEWPSDRIPENAKDRFDLFDDSHLFPAELKKHLKPASPGNRFEKTTRQDIDDYNLHLSQKLTQILDLIESSPDDYRLNFTFNEDPRYKKRFGYVIDNGKHDEVHLHFDLLDQKGKKVALPGDPYPITFTIVANVIHTDESTPQLADLRIEMIPNNYVLPGMLDLEVLKLNPEKKEKFTHLAQSIFSPDNPFEQKFAEGVFSIMKRRAQNRNKRFVPTRKTKYVLGHAVNYPGLTHISLRQDLGRKGYFLSRLSARDLDTANSTVIFQFKQDAAMTDNRDLGGIDMDPALVEMDVQHEGVGFQMPAFEALNNYNDVEGLVPVIIQITPITNLPLLLGLNPEQKDTEDLSQLQPLDPARIEEL